jgi:hypothetical protein
MVDGVEHMDASRPPCRNYRRSHFPGEEAAVCHRDEARTVDEGLCLCGDIGKVRRRSDQDAVGSNHLFDALVDDVVIKDAPLVLVRKALPACRAPVHLLAPDMDQFSPHPLVFQDPEHLIQQHLGVPSSPWASAECDYTHDHLMEAGSYQGHGGYRGLREKPWNTPVRPSRF